MVKQTDKPVKVTYSTDEQRRILLLKEAFIRDLALFQKLLAEAPREWTFTVLQSGSSRELVVNVPAKKPASGIFG